MLDAAVVISGNAADGVGGRRAVPEGYVLDGDVLARGDGASLFALCGAEGAGVVAVGDGIGLAVAHEGGAGMVVDIAELHLGLAVVEVGGGVEAIADGDGASGSPAYEASAVFGGGGAYGEQFAVEEA
ncbi:MAG: hypothetical protein J5867_08420, partial [Prevotella sp.]|nr:hypothetical protein [Prevotella sp.]